MKIGVGEAANMNHIPVRLPEQRSIVEQYKDFNIIPPWFSHRMRWNMRETLRQEYASRYKHLLDELDYLEYLYSQYRRGLCNWKAR